MAVMGGLLLEGLRVSEFQKCVIFWMMNEEQISRVPDSQQVILRSEELKNGRQRKAARKFHKEVVWLSIQAELHEGHRGGAQRKGNRHQWEKAVSPTRPGMTQATNLPGA